jgi:aminopeptidase N
VSDLRYQLDLAVPDSASRPVTGTAVARFQLAGAAEPLHFDFQAPAANLSRVVANGREVAVTVVREHVAIPRSALRPGENTIQLDFTATDAALNRHPEFLYALFVPDRSRSAFPVFDQPDLKARYRLSLRIPSGWQAVANGALESRDSAGPGHLLRFAETQPISSYLFSFAAGRLSIDAAERDGRTYHLFHRETDTARLARNRNAIVDLHAQAIEWLESYTGIPYPFGKFDFFAIPAFQFGGMEHPGAVWYRANTLFLDPTATRAQLLGRASVIAHETAHMWFGNLVTMRWFNDVWMKEVFANFMAGKIVEPAFPEVDHRLRFHLAHHAAAYAVDRTAGANPIRQPLENLNDAGSLYGAIIYEKAPIVMRQLELLIGEEAMRDGLREYLAAHRFADATWPDLIAVLDRKTPIDLAAWSRAWVEEPGRPTIEARLAPDRGSLTVTQRDSVAGRGLRWTQRLRLTARGGATAQAIDLSLTGTDTVVALANPPDVVLIGTDGVGYGRLLLDSTSRAWLLDRLETLPEAIERAVAWDALWEDLIDGLIPVERFLSTAERALGRERDDLLAQRILGLTESAFWRFSAPAARVERAPRLERVLWDELGRARSVSRKAAFFNTLVSVTLTTAGVARLEAIWRERRPPPGLPLAEEQYTELAQALAVRDSARAERILDEAERRISNPDRVARFRFVRRALSPLRAARDSVFASFQDSVVRRRSSWVTEANRALHHPLRADQAVEYLRPSLDMLAEIKRTGDIFFPVGWLESTFGGHQSARAAAIVSEFLSDGPDLGPRLKAKLLQAADPLFRAARVVEGSR